MAVLAKLSRPRLAGVYPRERLFARLDECRSHPAVWISGPPGAGKTTLTASYLDARGLPALWYQVDAGDADPASFFYYLGLGAKQAGLSKRTHLPLLTPEYLPDLAGFTRRYFRALCQGLPKSCTLVLDNYQDAPDSAPLYTIIRDALTEIPEGINAILVSRVEPPATYARLRTSHTVTELGWDELRLTAEEAAHVAANARGAAMPDDTRLVERCGGWAAGLVLMLDHPDASGVIAESAESRRALFDYFAAELFDRLPPETRHLLLYTSLVPWTSVAMAQALTGNSQAGALLEALRCKHLFTERRVGPTPTYQYHALLREFLVDRLQETHTTSERLRLAHKSAQLLARAGDVGTALQLYLTSGDEDAAVQLVLGNAPGMAAQGRAHTLENWLRALPIALRDQEPWVLYWWGQCRLSPHVIESREDLARAFAMFDERGDATGAYLSWSAVVTTFLMEWKTFAPMDHWIIVFDSLRARYPQFASMEIEARVLLSHLVALTFRQPHHPGLPVTEQRLRGIIPTVALDMRVLISAHLIHYYNWVGDYHKAENLIRELAATAKGAQISPFAWIFWRVTVATYHWLRAEPGEALRAVNEALELAEQTGVHAWNFIAFAQGTFASVCSGDLDAAQGFLCRLAPLVSTDDDGGLYRFQQALIALHRGNLPVAVEEIRAALDLTGEIPFTRAVTLINSAEIAFEIGDEQSAVEQLSVAAAIASSMRSRLLQHLCLFGEARIALDSGRSDRALQLLERALRLGDEMGGVSVPWWRPALKARMYAAALNAGIEVEHVKALIRRSRLAPPEDLVVEDWPWPVKIYTLGRFELLRDDQPVRFEGKAQHKPMELLKALIALGGDKVRANELIDILWADPLEGDEQKAFEITVHRLRTLLGNDKAIHVSDRRVTLNPQIVWVDLHALERKLAALIPASPAMAPDASELERAAAEILKLYRGHFLHSDGDLPWLLPVRNRLSGRFQRFVLRLGEHWEGTRQWTRAAELYQRGVELDPLAEVFYRRLMICLREQGQRAEACEVYRRCRQMLSITLGVKPVAATEAIYRELLGS